MSDRTLAIVWTIVPVLLIALFAASCTSSGDRYWSQVAGGVKEQTKR